MMKDNDFKIEVLKSLSRIDEKLEHVPLKEDLMKVEGLTVANKAKLNNHKWVLGGFFTGLVSIIISIFTGVSK